MTEARIRPAVVADAPGIASVHVASWRAAYPGIVAQSFLDGLSVERRTAFWSSVLGAPTTLTWVAERAGEIVGFVGLGPPDEADAAEMPPATLDLATIYVDPAVWRQGIGRALLDRAVGDVAADGVLHLMLWVFEANDQARRFYESAGWRPDGARRDHEVGAQRLPIVRYRLALGEALEAST
jgi:ribosomal protein S18 acetylase RimI-like enzyme